MFRPFFAHFIEPYSASNFVHYSSKTLLRIYESQKHELLAVNGNFLHLMIFHVKILIFSNVDDDFIKTYVTMAIIDMVNHEA